MKFKDLQRQYLENRRDIDNAINDVLCGANFIMGNKVYELEDKFKSYLGVKHCITCASGSDALNLLMMAYDIGKGDAIFVPDVTFIATASAGAILGATPIIVDIDITTHNMSPISLEKKILETINNTNLTPKAIIPVDLNGIPANYDELEVIASKYNLLLIEDAAQSIGSRIGNKKAGSFGDAACTSFFPAKPLGAYGDGGAILVESDHVAEKIKSLRLHGRTQKDKYDNFLIGRNSRLDTLQAAILIEKLRILELNELEVLNTIAEMYTNNLNHYITTPQIPSDYYVNWAQYSIMLDNNKERDRLKEFLFNKGIPTQIYYPRPLHRQRVFKKYNYKDEDYKNSIKVANQSLALPIHPYLNDDEIELIIRSVLKYFNS